MRNITKVLNFASKLSFSRLNCQFLQIYIFGGCKNVKLNISCATLMNRMRVAACINFILIMLLK